MSEQQNDGAAAVEQEARALGWVPEGEYRGDKSRWIDAETFVKRGTELMPILQANNRRLVDQNQKLQGRIGELEESVKAATESVEELRKFHTAETKRKVEDERKRIMAELKAAKKDGDVDAEVELTSALNQVDKALEAEDKRKPDEPPKRKPAATDEVHPDFHDWSSDNPWFGKDKRRTRQVMDVAQELRASGSRLEGRAFFDKCAEEAAETFGWDGEGRPATKYGSGRPTGGGARKGGKTYDDLPADAKAACDSYAEKIVRKGGPYPDMKSWRDYYTKEFFSEQA